MAELLAVLVKLVDLFYPVLFSFGSCVFYFYICKLEKKIKLLESRLDLIEEVSGDG